MHNKSLCAVPLSSIPTVQCNVQLSHMLSLVFPSLRLFFCPSSDFRKMCHVHSAHLGGGRGENVPKHWALGSGHQRQVTRHD